MKHILLSAVMFALVFGSPAAPTETRTVSESGASKNTEDVEGVTIYTQRTAQLKPGYAFRRESRSSVSVLKTIRNATLQTGTLSCTRAARDSVRPCSVDIGGDTARCGSGCYFVGVRGGVKAK